LRQGDIILFKTRNSDLDANQSFNPRFVYLTAEGAQYLIEKKIKQLGLIIWVLNGINRIMLPTRY